MKPSFWFSLAFVPTALAYLPSPGIANPIDSLVDVFPLHPGLNYTYSYYAITDWYDDYPTHIVSSDSGRVHYRIQDSLSIGDTVRVWSIIEMSDLMSHRMVGSHFYPPLDTTYRVLDTTSLQLFEHLSGEHQLICTGRVWQFPLHDLQGLPHDSIYRFAATPTYQLLSTWSSPTWPYYYGKGSDSLIFSSLLGLYFRKQVVGWGSGYQFGNDTLIVDELGHPNAIAYNASDNPQSAQLYQNFPNPFNPSTNIQFRIPRSAFVRIQVFNLLGQLVETLLTGTLGPGDHLVTWDSRDRPTGVYICTLQSRGYSRSIKLVLLK
jgi:hypothetical protein